MFNFSFQVVHSQSGAEYAVNLADLPVVAPLLQGIFSHLHQLPISDIPDEIPAIFFAQKPGFKTVFTPQVSLPLASLRKGDPLPPPSLSKDNQAVASHVLLLQEDQAVASPVLPLQDDGLPSASKAAAAPKVKPKCGKVLCKVCKKPQSKSNLGRHMKSCSDSPHPFKCEYPCRYSASRSDLITQHQDGGGCGRFDAHIFVIPYNS